MKRLFFQWANFVCTAGDDGLSKGIAQLNGFAATTINNKLDFTSSIFTSVSKPARTRGSLNLDFTSSTASGGDSPVALNSQSRNGFLGHATGRITNLPPLIKHLFTSASVSGSLMYAAGNVETIMSNAWFGKGRCCASPRVSRAWPSVFRLAR